MKVVGHLCPFGGSAAHHQRSRTRGLQWHSNLLGHHFNSRDPRLRKVAFACQNGKKFYNLFRKAESSMPREEIEITLSEADPYWSGALYFAVLAYPDPLERTQRDKYHQAIVRWTLERRMEMDEKWAQGLQLIRPVYFSGSDSLNDRVLKNGNKRLVRRYLVAQLVVLPHLRKFDTGRIHKVESFIPTFANMIALATTRLGLKEGTVDTVASRDWRPVKPIAHAMCAYFVWNQILWTMWGRNKDVDRKLAFLMLPQYVEEVVQIAEHFRPQVCEIAEFNVYEKETIRLLARWVHHREF
jgi:hypothetical protein